MTGDRHGHLCRLPASVEARLAAPRYFVEIAGIAAK